MPDSPDSAVAGTAHHHPLHSRPCPAPRQRRPKPQQGPRDIFAPFSFSSEFSWLFKKLVLDLWCLKYTADGAAHAGAQGKLNRQCFALRQPSTSRPPEAPTLRGRPGYGRATPSILGAFWRLGHGKRHLRLSYMSQLSFLSSLSIPPPGKGTQWDVERELVLIPECQPADLDSVLHLALGAARYLVWQNKSREAQR